MCVCAVFAVHQRFSNRHGDGAHGDAAAAPVARRLPQPLAQRDPGAVEPHATVPEHVQREALRTAAGRWLRALLPPRPIPARCHAGRGAPSPLAPSPAAPSPLAPSPAVAISVPFRPYDAPKTLTRPDSMTSYTHTYTVPDTSTTLPHPPPLLPCPATTPPRHTHHLCPHHPSPALPPSLPCPPLTPPRRPHRSSLTRATPLPIPRNPSIVFTVSLPCTFPLRSILSQFLYSGDLFLAISARHAARKKFGFSATRFSRRSGGVVVDGGDSVSDRQGALLLQAHLRNWMDEAIKIQKSGQVTITGQVISSVSGRDMIMYNMIIECTLVGFERSGKKTTKAGPEPKRVE